ncbi:hypothetical protein OJF2_54790 [Aquisphaera giovannonii]|uniref:Uncharacterized protein n=1 Tax=Aquisphaera giovannonii TaxID=406548 RepID=A0A5B9W9F2_9BACT|nr:hypothetical protein [Aquisphaera giovannonii]QEH36894.1 hypothetical protein OJF2_54790 [Aquisphaera giovannonii]
MILSKLRGVSMSLCLAPILLISPGCGASASPADPARAQETLRIALDAWKAGSKPGDLSGHATPIRVSDQEWAGGWTLLDYRVDDDGKLVGFDMNYPVELNLKRPGGGTVKKKAVYTVTTHPESLVLRQEG